MKKNLLYLFALICSVSLFTACSDDDEKTDDSWKAVSATYSAETLKLSLDGTEVSDQSVKVTANSAESASVVLTKLIPGEAEITVDAKMLKTGENYALEGENKTDLRTVSVKGSVESGILTLDVKLKITAPIAGTWKLAEIKKDENDSFVSGPLFMTWEAEDGTLLGGLLPIESIPALAGPLGSLVLGQVLQNVTFQDNGQIVASYSKSGISLDKPVTPSWETSEEGYAAYNVTETQILVFLNLEKIIAGSKSEQSSFDPLIELVKNGIPVNYEIASDGNSARVYIDKELVDKIVPLLPMLSGMIEDNALGGMGAFVKGLLDSFPEAMNKTTKLEIGLNLVK